MYFSITTVKKFYLLTGLLKFGNEAALQGCKLFTVIRIRQQPNQQRLSGNDNYLGNDRSARQAVNNAFFSPSLQEKLPSFFSFLGSVG